MKLAGSAVAPGLAMGAAALVGDILECRPGARAAPAPADADAEWQRIEAAFRATRSELAEAVVRVEGDLGTPIADVFRAHEMMLESLRSSRELAAAVRDSRLDAASAVRRVFRTWTEKFEGLADASFRERADDVADLGRRVLRRLDGGDTSPMADVPAGAVAVIRRLLPSDVIALAERGVAAIVVDSIGRASHAALLAREKGLPTVAVPDVVDRVRGGDDLLVDGYRGELWTDPDAAVREEFAERVREYRAWLTRCRFECHQKARTLDGTLVRVEANVGTQRDVEALIGNGADGVGLFRIEQLYLGREAPPSEDELLAMLQAIAVPLRDRPITFRLLDVGGDKPLGFLRQPPQTNPSLGVRGIRLLLRHPALLRTQLAAFARLSRAHDVRVLVPMITLEEDIRAAREAFDEVCARLDIDRPPPFGAMIETPAAALAVPAIGRHVDFLSVGTNDLTQYTFAAGRDDPSVDGYFQDGHASLLRLLEIVVREAGELPVTLCGELAGREELVPALLAIGVRALSVAPPLVPTIKSRVRASRIDAGAAPAERGLASPGRGANPRDSERIVDPPATEVPMPSSCEHLEGLTIADFPPPRTSACEECTRLGTVWVALRECRTCGHVGCCDDSPHRHASEHFRQTQHPVMRTLPGGFGWCYVHEVSGSLPPAKTTSAT